MGHLLFKIKPVNGALDMKLKKTSKIRIVTLSIVGGLFVAITIAANILAFSVFDNILSIYFGVSGASVNQFNTNQYYEREKTNAQEASDESEELCQEILQEGTILLKNTNNCLPLPKGSKVSFFSSSSVDLIYGSKGGSGAINDKEVPTLKTAFEANGINVNPTLWNFYLNMNYHRTTGGLASGVTSKDPQRWAINEVPYGNYTNEVKNSYSQYNDVAIFVISRTGCENGDLPTDLSYWDSSNSGSLLELDQNERDMIENVINSHIFKKTMVILNTGNVMECGFIDTYNIDAAIWIGGVGRTGLYGVSDVVAGVVSPSGRTVDTYPYDVFSSPAMQNFGNFAYTSSGNETGHHYVLYAEGIYVGYKYYETRYEDVTLQLNNNVGNYNYDEVVLYPFGYGLSYTEFKWDNYHLDYDDTNFYVSLDVTNTGNYPSKEVVEIYSQSPYTTYDKKNDVEKSSIELQAFYKTKVLKPNEKESVSIAFPIESLKSYDSTEDEEEEIVPGYILERSQDYIITAAKNAHEAVNNCIAIKKPSLGIGDDSLAAKYTNSKMIRYTTDNKTNNPISNKFSDASGENYHRSIKYLSRNKWNAVDDDKLRFGSLYGKDGDGNVYSTPITQTLRRLLTQTGYKASNAPSETFENVTFDKNNGLVLANYIGVDFNDSSWDDLLDQVSLSEALNIILFSGYKTNALTSIGKPYSTDSDGPSSWSSFIGDGINSGGFPYEVNIATTWNQEIAYRMGKSMGELSLWQKILSKDNSPNLTGWYAPAVNIHRTPFGGRNFEYFSEDALLSGKIGANVTKGARSKGVISFVKHFAMNEQETNRMTEVVTWSREQAIREIYLKPFEYCVKEGETLGIMSSYNRIGVTWAGGNYDLLTGILRNEWGFNGYVISDYMDGDYEETNQMLAAGGDAALYPLQDHTCLSNSNQSKTYIRRAMKHICYATVNSSAMNGIDNTTKITVGKPKYYRYMALVDTALGLVIVGCALGIFIPMIIQKKKERANER